ncbi:GNAT family N-acetyltransferase [Ornithinibacillus halotolerans]|uniref:Acetyltransferase n=1 Tax=Ornithinibacillus halotolerans TaxID=1274357 RepID=A0A916RVB1_9BACI|nr:GNAT family N-acetyltransferase [Ornithinibacillus halotolerans]GGA72399.1 acetyltransferase [Ornithinibacillus halotolerans]
MEQTVELIELTEGNLEEKGCYCLRSKPNSVGYKGKNEWLKGKFHDGLKYIKINENNKQAGFIEYVPIERSSRVVYGENYLVIHCLWVGITGKGYASQLIESCIQDAKKQQKAGVIVVTNPDTSWTPSKEVFIKNGFEEVDHAPYGFELLVYKNSNSANPHFPTDWEERLQRFEKLTILRTPQCPFIDVATDNVLIGANKLEIETTTIDLKDRRELLELSPTPYGVYGVVYKKQLIAYHRLTTHSAYKRLKELS